MVGHHRDREPQVLGLFHGLVPPQNAPPLVDHDGAARAVRVQAATQGLAAPIRPAVGVEGIGLQVIERLNGCLTRPRRGFSGRGHRGSPAGPGYSSRRAPTFSVMLSQGRRWAR